MDTEAVMAMLREDGVEWEALVAVLEAQAGESLHDANSPLWTSRDVYAHLARWLGHSTHELEARLGGRTLTRLEGTDDEINARWQQEDSGLSLGEARERARMAFERRLRAIKGVPTGRWDDGFEKIARADGSEHYTSHRSFIVDA